MSLQGVPGAAAENEHRFDDFRRDWNQFCTTTASSSSPPPFEYIQCPGQLHSIQGVGVTRAFIECFQKAIPILKQPQQMLNEPVAFFWEDDARPFNHSVPFCNSRYRQQMFKNMPNDTYLIATGGHHWEYQHYVPGTIFRKSTYSLGLYGMAIPVNNIPLLRDAWRTDLQEQKIGWDNYTGAWRYSPDLSWYLHAHANHRSIYATHPLLVYHPAGFSNTWGRNRNEEMGHSLRTTLHQDAQTKVQTHKPKRE
jgi:hypothetical protein